MIRALVALLVVASVAAAGWHRAQYKSWPWDGPPFWLDYCGRTYERADEPRPLPIDQAGERLRVAFRAPPVVGRQVLVPARGCADTVPTGIYVRAGDRRVVGYALLGGP